MRIVVAGGTGFLGSPLSEAWAEDGHDVRVLSVFPEQSQHDSGRVFPALPRGLELAPPAATLLSNRRTR
jgi:nucleoside-diphosphate-sugar epimerase